MFVKIKQWIINLLEDKKKEIILYNGEDGLHTNMINELINKIKEQ